LKEIIQANSFTPSQQKAYDRLHEFMKSKDTIITLQGAAGTGKTYLMDEFLSSIKVSSCVSAPTHKAVKVIEQATGKQGFTFHSLHGLRPNVNIDTFSLNNLKFDTLGSPKMPDYKLIVIDEASQINTSLALLNENRANVYNNKIVYIGDSFQLPPISERLSSVFSQKNIITLTDIVRQKDDNPMLDYYPILKNDILTDGSNFIKALFENQMVLNDRKEGYVILNDENFHELALKKMKENPFKNKYLGWKKESVADENNFIRRGLIGSTDILDINDTLMSYTTVIDEYLKPVLVNSIEYKIKSLHLTKNEYDLEVYVVTLESEFGEVTPQLQIINHANYDSFIRYKELVNNLYYNAITALQGNKKHAWEAVSEFKNSILCMITYNIKSSKYPIEKDITYSHGLTIHKSQGSTYDTVFLNLNEITTYNNGNQVMNTVYNKYAIELRNKLLYVAFTRAAKTVYIKT